jgi:hypothetical protein
MYRDRLLAQYADIKAEMDKSDLKPTVNDEVLDVLTDGELSTLVKHSLFRLLKFKNLEGEL